MSKFLNKCIDVQILSTESQKSLIIEWKKCEGQGHTFAKMINEILETCDFVVIV